MTGRETIDICPGWEPGEFATSPLEGNQIKSLLASPLTIVFGGNGAGKSAVFDAALFVLGQVAGCPTSIICHFSSNR